MSQSELSIRLLELLGGVENIEEISNCKTRLRASLIHPEKANVEELKKLQGVMGIIPFGSQYQIVLGEKTEELADLFINKLKIKSGNK